MTFSAEELSHILSEHRLWLAGNGGMRAVLRDAVLTRAVLTVLRDAVLTDLARAVLRDADIPIVPDLDRKILEDLEAGKYHLKMCSWHTCQTTHCRAGLAIMEAGEAGQALEKEVGPAVAGALIYHASTGRIPNFYASDADALADIRKCARQEKS